ncbi:Tubby-related protein 3 [Phytophthora cinnamomi]|uniref:Tubby-related protein 3 n=1 Tax=Phytophthora cinnamomi TaxID=4785 RepID=UPI00355A203C|nr:Tubby-related protein 3 [Phytophthora cinnamomi]
MVNRYFKLLEFIDSRDDDIADLMPSPACNRRLRGLLKDLKKVESVSKALQGEGVSLLDARIWLDGLISIKPHYARFIRPRAEIVYSPDFEAGCVKPAETNDDEEEESFVEQLQKRRRLAAKETKYKLLHIIPATSNKVERVFSVARITFGHERRGLMPITLEMILFLRENAAYWDAKTVDEAMH